MKAGVGDMTWWSVLSLDFCNQCNLSFKKFILEKQMINENM